MSSTTQAALPAPPGVVADLNHPTDVLMTVNYVTQAICIPLVTIFVASRFYARYIVVGEFGKDDYACLIAWVLMIGYCTCCILLSKHGGGHHIWEVPEDQLVPFMKTAYAATIFYAPMAFTVKVALLLILIRVFEPFRRTVILIYVLLSLLAAYYIACLVVKIRICLPISAYWNGDLDKCLNQGAVITADSIISVVSDLAILILPLPLTWSLHMPNKKKIRVAGMLGAGGLATAFSIYRLAMIVNEGDSVDQTMVFTKVVLSGNAEVGIGLICACLPAMSALIIRKSREYSSRKNGQSSTNYELGSAKRSDGLVRSKPRKRDSRMEEGELEPASDQSTLVFHAQGEPVETSIHGRSRSKSPSWKEDENQGIMKTVGVTYDVSYC